MSRTESRLLAAICKVIRKGESRKALNFYPNPALRLSNHLNMYTCSLVTGNTDARGTYLHFNKSSLVLALSLLIYNCILKYIFMYKGSFLKRCFWLLSFPNWFPGTRDVKNTGNDKNIQSMRKQLSRWLKLFQMSFFFFFSPPLYLPIWFLIEL